MSSKTSGPMAAAALLAASVFATPSAAIPVAALAAVPAASPIQQARWVRHRYYGCRPGWYCFGPPYSPPYVRGWYGGFNSIYGYQGGRWRAADPAAGYY
jgi:hypothetical protein